MNITHWFVSALAIMISAYLIPGVHVTIIGALVLAVVWGLINVFIKPVISILTFPVTIITLGLFSLVVNALLIILSAKIVPGFSVDTFWSAFFFAIILSLVTALFGVSYGKKV